jgi:hypothetical protein
MHLFRDDSKWLLREYPAVSEWAHNLQDLTADFRAMMVWLFTSAGA